jgi:hypothetical protein
LDKAFTDNLVVGGELRKADKTIITGLLRDIYHPTGLVERTNRREDGEEYEQKLYKAEKE